MDYWDIPKVLSDDLDRTEKITLLKETNRVCLTILASTGNETTRRALQPSLTFFLACVEDSIADNLLFNNEPLLLHLVSDELHNVLSGTELQFQLLQALADCFCRHLQEMVSAGSDKWNRAPSVAGDSCMSGASESEMLAKVLNRVVFLLLKTMSYVTTAAITSCEPCQKTSEIGAPPSKRVRRGEILRQSATNLATGLQWSVGNLTLLQKLLALLLPASMSHSDDHYTQACTWCMEAVSLALLQQFPSLTDCIFRPTAALLLLQPSKFRKKKSHASTTADDHESRLHCLVTGLEILSLLFSSSHQLFSVPIGEQSYVQEGEKGLEESEASFARKPTGASNSHPQISLICSVIDYLQQLYSCLYLAANQSTSLMKSRPGEAGDQFWLKVKYATLLHMEYYAQRFPVHFFHHARLSRNNGEEGGLISTSVNRLDGCNKNISETVVSSTTGDHFTPHARLTLLHALISDVTVKWIHNETQTQQELNQQPFAYSRDRAHASLSTWQEGFKSLSFELIWILLSATPRYDDDILHAVEQLLFVSPSSNKNLIPLANLSCHVHCLRLLLFVLYKEKESKESVSDEARCGEHHQHQRIQASIKGGVNRVIQRRSPYFNVPRREKLLTNQLDQYITCIIAAVTKRDIHNNRKENFEDMMELIAVTIETVTTVLQLYVVPVVPNTEEQRLASCEIPGCQQWTQQLIQRASKLVKTAVQMMGLLGGHANSPAASTASLDIKPLIQNVLSFMLYVQELEPSHRRRGVIMNLPAPYTSRMYYHNVVSLFFDSHDLLTLRRYVEETGVLEPTQNNYRKIIACVLKQETSQDECYRRHVGLLISTILLSSLSPSTKDKQQWCCCDLFSSTAPRKEHSTTVTFPTDKNLCAIAISSMLLFFKICLVVTLTTCNDTQNGEVAAPLTLERVMEILVNKVVSEHTIQDWAQFQCDLSAASGITSLPFESSCLFYDVGTVLLSCLLYKDDCRVLEDDDSPDQRYKNSFAQEFICYLLTGCVVSERTRAIAMELNTSRKCVKVVEGGVVGASSMNMCFSVTGVALVLSMLPDPLLYLQVAPYLMASSPKGSSGSVDQEIEGPLWSSIVCCHPCCKQTNYELVISSRLRDEAELKYKTLTLLQLKHPVISSWRAMLLLDTATVSLSFAAGSSAFVQSPTYIPAVFQTSHKHASTTTSHKDTLQSHHLSVLSDNNKGITLEFLASLVPFSHNSSTASAFLCVHNVWELVALLYQNYAMVNNSTGRNCHLNTIRLVTTLQSINMLLPYLVLKAISASFASTSSIPRQASDSTTPVLTVAPGFTVAEAVSCNTDFCHNGVLTAADILNTLDDLVTALWIACRAQIQIWTPNTIRDILEILRSVLVLIASPSISSAACLFCEGRSRGPCACTMSESVNKTPTSWLPHARATVCSLLLSLIGQEKAAISQLSEGLVIHRLLCRSLMVLELLNCFLTSTAGSNMGMASSPSCSSVDTLTGGTEEKEYLISLLARVHLATGERLLHILQSKQYINERPLTHQCTIPPLVSRSLQLWISLSSTVTLDMMLFKVMSSLTHTIIATCLTKNGVNLKEGKGPEQRLVPNKLCVHLAHFALSNVGAFLQNKVDRYPFASADLPILKLEVPREISGTNKGFVGNADKKDCLQTVISLGIIITELLCMVAANRDSSSCGNIAFLSHHSCCKESEHGDDHLFEHMSQDEWLLGMQCQCGDLFLTLISDSGIIDALPVLRHLWWQQGKKQQEVHDDAHYDVVLNEYVLWKLLLLRYATLSLALLHTHDRMSKARLDRAGVTPSVTSWREVLLAPEVLRWVQWLREVGVLLPSSSLLPPDATPLPTSRSADNSDNVDRGITSALFRFNSPIVSKADEFQRQQVRRTVAENAVSCIYVRIVLTSR